MVARVIGNRGTYFGTGVGGAGIQFYPDGIISSVCISGETGDRAYLPASSINSSGKLYRGYSFQSGAGGIVDFTLSNAAFLMSRDPAIAEQALWGNTLTVPAGGEIVFAPFAVAGIRITLTGNGELYIVAS